MPRSYFFKTPAAFDRWLARNHATSTVLLVGFYKVGSGKSSIRYAEALDTALAYGWIDGVRRRLSDDAYAIVFTPRKKSSYWSAVNTKRARALIKNGRMKPAGLAAFSARDADRTRRHSSERQNTTFDGPILRTLRNDKKAFAFFEALPPGMKKLVMHWITSARREETRTRRLAHLIERSHAGKRIDLLRPFGDG